MTRNKRIRENQAVSGVIEALLLVALVAIIIATIQLVYIPQIMYEREAAHMDEVSNQFSYLKSMIDIQYINEADVPMFSMITLGSRELPYFVTARAFGELSVVTGEDSSIEVDYGNVTSLTSIKYEAFNSYFVDQTYVLEGGGIIVTQPEGESVMRVAPTISVTKGDAVSLVFDVPVFIDIPGKNSTYGHGKCFIRTNYSGSSTQPFNPINDNVRIYTQYLNAWNESLCDLLGDAADIVWGPNYIEIQPKGTMNVQIREIEVYAQIGPGWVV